MMDRGKQGGRAKICHRTCDETFRALLQRKSYVYRRPKHGLKPLQDREAKERSEAVLDSLKKAETGQIHLFFIDKTILTLHPLLRKCWMKRGKQLRVAAASKQQHHHLFGAYNHSTNQVIWLDAENKTPTPSSAFLSILWLPLIPRFRL